MGVKSAFTTVANTAKSWADLTITLYYLTMNLRINSFLAIITILATIFLTSLLVSGLWVILSSVM